MSDHVSDLIESTNNDVEKVIEDPVYENMGLFQNPDHLPIEKLKLKINTENVTKLLPALDEYWVEKKYFLHYERPEIYNEDGNEIIGAKERWTEITLYIIDDIQWLLRLPFHKFWSNIVHNSVIFQTIVSFLQEAPPFYDLEYFPNVPEMMEVLENLRKNILIVFARIVTNKESTIEYMDHQFLGNLLYENDIITIPIIFDLCQLYGRNNEKTIEKILQILFTLQPCYFKDLEDSVPFLMQALENVEQRFSSQISLSYDAVALADGKMDTSKLTLSSLEDMLTFVLDIISSISILLQRYPPVIKIFHHKDFLNKMVSVYENVIPEMYKKLHQLAYNEESMPKYIDLKHRLDVTRIEMLQLYRIIIQRPIEIIEARKNISTEEIKQFVDEYLDFLSDAISESESEFIMDYDICYPIVCDLEHLQRICPHIDTIKCGYIVQGINATTNHRNDIKISSSNNISDITVKATLASVSGLNVKNEASINTNNIPSSSKQTIVRSSVELASLITEVKDIFSDFGEGFIEKCLTYYDYDTKSLINAILENELPPHLDELDRSLPQLPPDPMASSSIIDKAIGSERLNIYDNDEFDVMTRDFIDTSKIHIGKKKDKYKNMNELLNDKSEVKNVGDFYNKYSIITDEYNDEYDDTYDAHNVREFVQDDVVEIDSRPFTTPRVFCKTTNERVADNEDSEEEICEVRKDQFLQDPAELRAKAEQRRQSQRGNRDVIGNPRGHGQNKDVLINRQNKNKNKSTHANHNRRAGAQHKLRQGMVPS